MAKRSAPRGLGGARANPMQQQGALQALQQRMQEMQEALATETIQVSAGGGAVVVVITGQQKLQSIKISPELLTAGDVEMVQDMTVAAVNEAIEKSQQLASSKMSELTGGLSLPGLM